MCPVTQRQGLSLVAQCHGCDFLGDTDLPLMGAKLSFWKFLCESRFLAFPSEAGNL